MQKKIYMDCNSTTAMLPIVQKKILEIMSIPCNPSSQHFYGQYAKKIIEDARNIIKKSINANEDYELIFTSGGTESNNIVMNNMHNHIISAIEHPSILYSAKKPEIIPVNQDGILDLHILEEKLKIFNKNCIVSIIYANNETGVIQNIKLISEIAHKYGAIIHTDAVQAYGKISIDVKVLDVDIITISGHKVGGVIGAGALIFKKHVQINPLFLGGSQEKGYRSGTENVIAIAGMSLIATEIKQIINNMKKVALLKDLLESQIRSIIDKVIICSEKVERLPNTSVIITPNISNELQIMYFDMHGIAISAGSACSSGKVEVSHVLMAMGISKTLAKCAVRISLSAENSENDINTLVNLWKMLYNSHT